jgi:hypothetical protein
MLIALSSTPAVTWYHPFVAPAVECGLDPKRLTPIYEFLPLSAAGVLHEAFSAIQAITEVQGHTLRQCSSLYDSFAQYESARAEVGDDGTEDELWDNSTVGARFRVRLGTDGTRHGAYATKYFSVLYGIHHEELLSRIGAGEAHLPFCDLEHLGNLVHEMTMGTCPTYARCDCCVYLRVHKSPD